LTLNAPTAAKMTFGISSSAGFGNLILSAADRACFDVDLAETSWQDAALALFLKEKTA
jgi:hypothetical protein